MIVYPENSYVVEIVHNSMKDKFSIWFNEKPEELIEHLLTTVGFKMRSHGKEFYHTNDFPHIIFAEQLQKSLRSGCLPKIVPYESSFPQTVSSITAENFSIATLNFVDSEGVLSSRKEVLFERRPAKSKALAWVIGKLYYGDRFKNSFTTYRKGIKEGINLFNNGRFVSTLPMPFGSDCLPSQGEDENTNVQTVENHDEAQTVEKSDGENDSSNDRSNDLLNGSEDVKEVSMQSSESVVLTGDQQLSNDGKEDDLADRSNDSSNDGFNGEKNETVGGSSLELSQADVEQNSEKLLVDQENRKNNRPEIIAPINAPYTYLFLKLHELIPNLVSEIEEMIANERKPRYLKSSMGSINEQGKYKQGAMMDANFEFLDQDEEGRYVISLSHYYEQNGDLVADPEMEIRIDPILQTAEALHFYNAIVFQEVYEKSEKHVKVDRHQKKSQNDFLQLWLRNLVNQGHFFDLAKPPAENVESVVVSPKSQISQIAAELDNVLVVQPQKWNKSESNEENAEIAQSEEEEISDELIKVSSITYSIKDSAEGLINVQHFSKDWKSAEAYFQKVVDSKREHGNIVEFTAKWENGMTYKSKIVLNERNLEWFKGENIIAFSIAKGILNQLHYSKGRIQSKVPAMVNSQKKLENALYELDFGTSIENVKEILKPKVPIASIIVDTGGSEILNIQHEKLGLVDLAIRELEFASTLVGIQENISLYIHWDDGQDFTIELNPFGIANDIPDHFFYEMLKEEEGTDFVKKYQTMEDQALLFENEIRPVNEREISSSLFDSMWKESDTKIADKIMVRGTNYHIGRLAVNLLSTLSAIPFEEQFKTLELFSKKFDKENQLGNLLSNTLSTDAEIDRFERQSQLFLTDTFLNREVPIHRRSEAFQWLIDHISDQDDNYVDMPLQQKKVKPKKKAQKGIERLELNQKIEKLIDEKGENRDDYTKEELALIESYTGYGGLAAGGVRAGALYEYYTPEPLIQKMYGLAFEHGYRRGAILESSCGTGRFIKYAPITSRIVGYETNLYSATICKLLYPYTTIVNKQFETIFFDGNIHLKDNYQIEPFDLAIGNPPYGEFSGKYAGMGERKYTEATEYDQYFILRGLDLLKPEGLLVYLISSHFYGAKKAYKKVKRKIAEKAQLVDFYKLPNGALKYTDVGTDIIVLKKR